jgi:NAD(P)-dependent dehydrogenase (short-subunit alcohol dehydrogenase family)
MTIMLLKDKTCVITGAASLRSIGYATAELFARNGARIAILDIAMDGKTVEIIASSIFHATGVAPAILGAKCDIQQAADCDRAVAEVVAKHGSVDCLVNCAGVVKAQSMLSITEADYDRILDVNLKGTFNICRSVLHVFTEQKRGVIISLASVAAQRGGGLVGGAHYAASKGGVISLTRSIAREFGPLGIRANVICPSMIETGMLDGNVTAQQFEAIVAGIPLKRAGKPADIAGACLFLASDLSAYVTGATIDVNGGSHIH